MARARLPAVSGICYLRPHWVGLRRRDHRVTVALSTEENDQESQKEKETKRLTALVSKKEVLDTLSLEIEFHLSNGVHVRTQPNAS